MKKNFDLHTIIIYSFFYKQIFNCRIANHQNLQEYKKVITKIKNKLVELGNLLPKLAVNSIFLNKVNILYQT